MTFRDLSGAIACDSTVAGRYLWHLEGSTLTFTLIQDACAGRTNAMLGHPWTRQAAGQLALTGVTLIDGTDGPARAGMTIVIGEGRIADLFPDGAQTIPAGVTVRNLRGRFVIPGLIDTHVHLATDPSGTDVRAKVESRLRRTLLGGVTSVRDMAGDARALADLARAAKVGDIVSPFIYYSALFAGPDFFTDPRVQATSRGEIVGQAPWARAVTPATDWRQVIAEARGTGASGIKLYAALGAEVLAPIVTEAHAQGLPVWAHAALLPARPSDGVEAGIDVLSHILLIAREADSAPVNYRERYRVDYDKVPITNPAIQRLVGAMLAKHTIVEPTLFVYLIKATDQGSNDQRNAGVWLDSLSPASRWAAAMTRELNRRGVPISAGTDGIIGIEGRDSSEVGALPNLHRELELLVHFGGLSPQQAIIAATGTAARAIGIDSLVGTIAPGKRADLVILTADPTADISNTRKIELVMREGKIFEPAKGR